MVSKQQSFAVTPSKGLGFLLLGSSIRDILTRLRSQPEFFPNIRIQFAAGPSIAEPLNIVLPDKGLRLRFDGPDQRLRLIEILDFSRISLTYKGQDLVKTQEDEAVSGLSFRHVYSKLFGPTFEGEYFTSTDESSSGLYILSYPGVAFSFNVLMWPENSDFVSILSSSSASSAISMSIFNGSSWKDARKDLYNRPCPQPRSLASVGRPKDSISDEIELAVIKGEGHIELRRRILPPLDIFLGETTPQDLVLTLGPPDAIYRKNDRRLSIHKEKPTRKDHHHNTGSTPPDRYGDTDRSSISTTTDYSSPEEEASSSTATHHPSQECFYNYFSHGFDIFMSHQITPSPPLNPSSSSTHSRTSTESIPRTSTNLVATKFILHGNVPGSHSFNRHRKSRWILDPTLLLLPQQEHQPPTAPTTNNEPLTSETNFSTIRSVLNGIWSSTLAAVDDSQSHLTQQRHMVLNRGWGDSPGSSIELLGGWEDADLQNSVLLKGGDQDGVGDRDEGQNADRDRKMGLGNTELYGWPGLLFEVLKNDVVDCVTVF